jgi:hypothetical protein
VSFPKTLNFFFCENFVVTRFELGKDGGKRFSYKIPQEKESLCQLSNRLVSVRERELEQKKSPKDDDVKTMVFEDAEKWKGKWKQVV